MKHLFRFIKSAAAFVGILIVVFLARKGAEWLALNFSPKTAIAIIVSAIIAILSGLWMIIYWKDDAKP